MLIFFMLSLAVYAPSSLAQDITLHNLAPPKIQAIAPSKVQVKESVVEFENKKYKRIEYQGEFFYLRMQSKEFISAPNKPESEESSSLDANAKPKCLRDLPNAEENALILSEAKITRVASVYIEGLRNKCQTFDVRRHWDGEAGLKLKTSKNSDVRMGINAAPETGLTPKGTINLGF